MMAISSCGVRGMLCPLVALRHCAVTQCTHEIRRENDTTMNDQCGGWAAPLREQQHRRMESLTVPNCTWREGLWVRHGRAGDGRVSALPAPASPCAAVGVGGDGGALVQPPQPLRVEQCPWMILPLSRAEACHEYSSTTDIESGRKCES